MSETTREPHELSAAQIQEILPHRYPFLLVDRILDYVPGEMAIGRKCVSNNEMQFLGHFPGYPVMPGVLLIEAMAQVGAVAMLSLPENKGKLAFFGGIKNARFKRQVVPGDVVEICVKQTMRMDMAVTFDGIATVGGKQVLSATLSTVEVEDAKSIIDSKD